jgi:hypothetical protein
MAVTLAGVYALGIGAGLARNRLLKLRLGLPLVNSSVFDLVPII